jgi:hypothetical protein
MTETKWNDIATAPKDGTAIDVWAVNSDGHACRIPDVAWEPITDWDGRVYEGWTGMFPSKFCAKYEPTHWLPLPTPPEPTR